MFVKKTALALAMVSIAALVPALVVAGSPAWDDAKALASRENKPILLDFYTDW